jgi:hypothetical protein
MGNFLKSNLLIFLQWVSFSSISILYLLWFHFFPHIWFFSLVIITSKIFASSWVKHFILFASLQPSKIGSSRASHDSVSFLQPVSSTDFFLKIRSTCKIPHLSAFSFSLVTSHSYLVPTTVLCALFFLSIPKLLPAFKLKSFRYKSVFTKDLAYLKLLLYFLQIWCHKYLFAVINSAVHAQCCVLRQLVFFIHSWRHGVRELPVYF